MTIRVEGMMRDSQDTWLPQPDLDEVDIGEVLQALADPVRLQIVRLLAAAGEGSCTSLDVPVKRSTVSHHLRTLRESGVVATRLVGNTRLSRLRTAELEERFPGLLVSILAATPRARQLVG
ncbi:ArsR/SmtB family transcription factor [Saccharothrix sp. ST-888]|uniref:ArsR/SmtB family transcription factor n=1 Tax=Saccharothrix sp. ST-888 TaxID=1427391 RepID=UPI000AF62D7A|nr:metalloregulator ArsR/SmtB family transcription factor [Saccharothrix sp. ST-888]